MNIAFASKGSSDNYLANSTISATRISGLGCYLAWVFMLFYMTKAYPEGIELRDTLYLNQTLSTMALALGLAILGVIASKKPDFKLSKRLIVPATVIMFIGSAYIVLGRFNEADYFAWAVILSGLLTGFGSSIILGSWGVAIIPNTARTRLVECAFAFTAALSNCFILNFLPEYFTLLLILFTPLATGVLSVYCLKHTRPLSLPSTKNEDPKTIRRLTIRACISALCFGIIAGFIDVLSGYRIFSVGEYYDALLLGIATFCSFSILAIALLVKRDALVVCYRVAIFIAILGCMLTPFMTDGNTYPNAIIAGSYITAQIVVFTLAGTFAKRFGYKPIRSFCIGAAALYIGESLGLLFCLAITGYIPNSTPTIFAITVVLAAGLLFSYLFLFTERDFINHHFGYSGVDRYSGTELSSPEASNTHGFLDKNTSLIIAQKYGLTSREIEVFNLVIQGRSNARIQEELFISSGTVSTHINHIYRKCGVNNKQELLDIIQEYQDEHTEAPI